MKRTLAGVVLVVLSTLGCTRQKAPIAKHVYLGPTGGCMQTLPHPRVGELACWGKLPGDTSISEAAVKREFAPGVLNGFAFGPGRVCAVHADKEAWCWDVKSSTPVQVMTGDHMSVGVGAAFTCFRTGGDFSCTGELPKSEDLKPTGKLRGFAVGPDYACTTVEGLGVKCRGGKNGEWDSDIQTIDALSLSAGPSHVCAVLSNRTVACWGKNDAGQLGDQTTNDSKTPVAVLGLEHVAYLAVGRRHSCALIGNGTVSCWGANEHHQLANGETKDNGRAAMVLGALGVGEISASGDATCVRMGQDGEVRCWGSNAGGQLGGDPNVEHTVPAGVKFH